MSTDPVRNSSSYPQYSLLTSADDLALELGGDVSARVAAMMLVHAKESREGAEEARSAEEQSIQAAENQQVAQMRAQADDKRDAAWAKGTALILDGTTELASISAPAGKKGNAERAMWSGAGKLSSGVGELSAAESNFRADRHETEATRQGNVASRGERALAKVESTIDDARDLSRTAIDFLENVREGEAANNRAAIYLRG